MPRGSIRDIGLNNPPFGTTNLKKYSFSTLTKQVQTKNIFIRLKFNRYLKLNVSCKYSHIISLVNSLQFPLYFTFAKFVGLAQLTWNLGIVHQSKSEKSQFFFNFTAQLKMCIVLSYVRSKFQPEKLKLLGR